MKALKYKIRTRYQNLQNLYRRASGRYAGQLLQRSQAEYPYLWHQATTPIPDRGTPEIRRNRIANLQRATTGIDQLLLRPGQRFCFSERVGEPTIKNGFRAGPVFVGGQVKTDVGGGLCLIATNLFSLFLYTGLQILERHCHSIDAYGAQRFYRLGEDAAVAYGYKDLIVRNQSSVQLLVRLEVLPDLGLVRSQLWGAGPCPWEVEVVSTVLEEIPGLTSASLPGWIVETERQRRPKILNPEAPTPWQQDFQTISHYQPCQRSQPNVTSLTVSGSRSGS